MSLGASLLSRIVVYVCTAGIICAQANGIGGPNTSIYLLNGMAGKVPTVLYEVGLTNGQTRSEIPVATGGPDWSDSGLAFILPDYERRVIIMGGPKDVPSQVLTLSMDSPSKPWRGSIESEAVSGLAPLLVDTSSSNELRIVLFTREENPRLFGTTLRGGGRLTEMQQGELGRFRLNGHFGTVRGSQGGMDVNLEESGAITAILGKARIDLALPTLGLTKQHPKRQSGWLEIKNDSAVVIRPDDDIVYSRDGLGSSVHYVYSNSAKAWHAVSVPGSTSKVCSFGKWLAFVVSEAQPWAVPNEKHVLVYRPTEQRTSPGQAGRVVNLLATVPRKTSMDEIFQVSKDWFPGVLLLYNVTNGRLYRLETGEGDSEILLVEGTDVYYRVNANLMKAPIGPDAIGPATQITTGPVAGNVHSAFISRHPPE